MRKALGVLVVLAALMLIALPAVAQTEGGDEATGTAISVTATVVFVSGGIAYLIEWARSQWPGLDGSVVRVVSVALAAGSVLLWDLRVAADYGYAGLPEALDVLASALIIAGLGGAIASWKNSKRAADPTSSIHSVGGH